MTLLHWLKRRLPGGATPLLVLLLVGMVGMFVALADEVIEGETHRFDTALLLALRTADDSKDPIGPIWFQEAARDITALGGTAVLTLITAASATYLLIVRQKAAAILLLVSVVGGTALNLGLKRGFDRPRPDLVSHAAEAITASFPSGHAMMSAITFLTLGALIARVQPRQRLRVFVMGLAVVITVLVGVTRVYLGVHWPSDVAAGWAVGSAWALACWLVLARFKTGKGGINPPPEPSG